MSSPRDSTPRVLVVGVGQMGSGMARRCIDAGFITHVIDTETSLRFDFENNWLSAEVLSTFIAINKVVILLCVVDASQAEELLFSPTDETNRHHHGLVHRVAKPSVFVLTSTMGVAEVQRIGERLQSLGHACIDAPVSGGPLRARDGSMSMMLAGDPTVLRSAAAVLNVLSQKQTCVGSTLGSATRVKLLNNGLAAAHLYAHAQVLAASQALDISADLLQKVIDESSGQSWIGAHRGHRYLAGDASVHARMALLAKDSRLALSLLQSEGLESDWLQPAAAAFAQACERGYRDRDDSEMHHFVVRNHTRQARIGTRSTGHSATSLHSAEETATKGAFSTLTESAMPGKFELKRSKNDKYFFSLLASNGQTVLGSEMYEAKASALNGIASVQKNAALDARYEKLVSTKGDPYFVLKAGNHQVIGNSQMYSSEASRDAGIESCKTNGVTTVISDLT